MRKIRKSMRTAGKGSKTLKLGTRHSSKNTFGHKIKN